MESDGTGFDGSHMWSPDIIFLNNETRIYYAGNCGSYNWWGSNSTIGLLNLDA